MIETAAKAASERRNDFIGFFGGAVKRRDGREFVARSDALGKCPVESDTRKFPRITSAEREKTSRKEDRSIGNRRPPPTVDRVLLGLFARELENSVR
jgi:hypothetical protein